MQGLLCSPRSRPANGMTLCGSAANWASSVGCGETKAAPRPLPCLQGRPRAAAAAAAAACSLPAGQPGPSVYAEGA